MTGGLYPLKRRKPVGKELGAFQLSFLVLLLVVVNEIYHVGTCITEFCVYDSWLPTVVILFYK
jgi:hypothetical protein